jgi:hypothetical protein
MSGHVPRGGLLNFLSEAGDIEQELNVSFGEALDIQSQRARERIQLAEAAEESRVIPRQAKH